MHIYICIYLYIHIYVCKYIYIYIMCVYVDMYKDTVQAPYLGT